MFVQQLLVCSFTLWLKRQGNFSPCLKWTSSVCLPGYIRNMNSNWCSSWPCDLLSLRNPHLLQASSLPLWSSAWASTPPVCSGAPSAARREPACCTTMWPTGICMSASPSFSSHQLSSCTPPHGSVWERTTGNTSKTTRGTSRPPNSSPPTWLWTIWEKISRRTQPTGQNSYTTWRTVRHVTTWSLFYSAGLHWGCKPEPLMCNRPEAWCFWVQRNVLSKVPVFLSSKTWHILKKRRFPKFATPTFLSAEIKLALRKLLLLFLCKVGIESDEERGEKSHAIDYCWRKFSSKFWIYYTRVYEMVYFPLVFLRYGISENAKRVTVINFQSICSASGDPYRRLLNTFVVNPLLGFNSIQNQLSSPFHCSHFDIEHAQYQSLCPCIRMEQSHYCCD